MLEVVRQADDEDGQQQAPAPVSFLKLHSLKLVVLSSLTCFASGSCVFDFHSLPTLTIDRCPSLKTFIQRPANAQTIYSLFDDKVQFPNLEDIFLHDVGMQNVWNDDNQRLSLDSFSKLKSLRIRDCQYLEAVIPFNMLRRLQNLEVLSITNCIALKEVFKMGGSSNQNNGAADDDVEKLKVRILGITGCERLSHTLVPQTLIKKLQNLEEVTVVECNSLYAIFDCECESLILPKLQKLTVGPLKQLAYIFKGYGSCALPSLKGVSLSQCKNLISLFPNAATARTLQGLESLSIIDCESMQEVVREADNDEDGQQQAPAPVSFLKLHSLKLFVLSSLTCFASGSCVFDFPSLATLTIDGSSSLKTFIQRPAAHDNAQTIYSFFDDKVQFPKLEGITLRDVGIPTVWKDEQPPCDSFSMLKSLTILGCKNVVTIIPFNMLRRLQNLEKLTIGDCIALKEVFKMGGSPNQTLIKELQNLEKVTVGRCESLDAIFDCECESLSLPNLQELTVVEVRQLKYIFKGYGSCALPILKEVEVTDCDNIIYLFPNAATASTLQGLESLTIGRCESMLEVVRRVDVEDGQQQAPALVSFLKLHSLKLVVLSSLTCFASGSCVFDFPSLPTLSIDRCPSLKAFIGRPANALTIYSLFDDKVQFPKLETINLQDVGIQTVWEDEQQPSCDSFSMLKSLVIQKCKNLVTIIPFNMLRRLQNLEKLFISECIALKEVFKMGGSPNQTLIKELQNLENVTVGRCESLDVIFDCECESLILPNLQHLTVFELKQLKYIFKGNGSCDLPSLKEVTLSECKNLIYLFPNAATARTLQGLESITIALCESMQEVVRQADDGEDSQQQAPAPVSFLNLHSLKLYKLSRLRCFASGTCVFDFPYLGTLTIAWCSSLKTFIQRPSAHDNAQTIYSLFDDKVQFPKLEEIVLQDVGIPTVWKDEQPPCDSFSKLKSLQIGECKYLETIIPFNMMRRLQNLEKLSISDCVELTEIFQMKGLTGDNEAAAAGVDFVKLTKAAVSGCNKLNFSVPPTIARKFRKASE